MTEEVRRLIDKEAIRDLLCAYCRSIDRRDMALLRSLVLPDAQFDYGVFSGTASEFADFAGRALANVGPTHHNLTTAIIRVEGDIAESESYCIAVHGEVLTESELTDLVVYLRYIDSFVRHDGLWKIARRLVIYDWNQNPPKTALWDGPRHKAYRPRGGVKADDPSQERFFL
ncbi:MAG: nuclear transport factor 2 family protein [Amphiplicatus sp.]